MGLLHIGFDRLVCLAIVKVPEVPVQAVVEFEKRDTHCIDTLAAECQVSDVVWNGEFTQSLAGARLAGPLCSSYPCPAMYISWRMTLRGIFQCIYIPFE